MQSKLYLDGLVASVSAEWIA